jgi:predicted amidohydrolase YtcJ
MRSQPLSNRCLRRLAVVVTAAALQPVGALAWAAEAAAIFVGGRVHSSSGVLEAIAIDSRGVILATGSTAEIEKLAASGTRRIELQGRTVLPGFHDQHVHPLFAGLSRRQCVIPQGATLAELQKHLRECATRTPKGQWIFGGQWDASTLAVTPHRSQLDAVTLDHPVLIYDTSGIAALATNYQETQSHRRHHRT